MSPGHGDVNFEFIIREATLAGYTGPFRLVEDNGMDRLFGAKEALEFVHKIDFALNSELLMEQWRIDGKRKYL